MTPADPLLPNAGEHAAFVTARLIDDPATRIGVATFEPDEAGERLGDGRLLSGWSLLVGDETAAEVDDPEAIRLPSLPRVLELHPDLADVLDRHDGTAASYIRDGDGWRRA